MTGRRSGAPAGPIPVTGAEPHLPYDRPPLSKQVLAGSWEPDATMLAPVGASIDGLEADWRLGSPATGLDLSDRRVELANGDSVSFDGLVLATGASVRRLPGQPDLPGI